MSRIQRAQPRPAITVFDQWKDQIGNSDGLVDPEEELVGDAVKHAAKTTKTAFPVSLVEADELDVLGRYTYVTNLIQIRRGEDPELTKGVVFHEWGHAVKAACSLEERKEELRAAFVAGQLSRSSGRTLQEARALAVEGNDETHGSYAEQRRAITQGYQSDAPVEVCGLPVVSRIRFEIKRWLMEW